MPEYKRVSVLNGVFGSGKSECSISLALQLAASKQEEVALVDIDLVNSNFCSMEVRKILEQNEVRL